MRRSYSKSSVKIEKTCTSMGLKASSSLKHTVKQLVVRVKENTSEEKRKNVVYQVAYNDCKKVHIDETKRTLKI